MSDNQKRPFHPYSFGKASKYDNPVIQPSSSVCASAVTYQTSHPPVHDLPMACHSSSGHSASSGGASWAQKQFGRVSSLSFYDAADQLGGEDDESLCRTLTEREQNEHTRRVASYLAIPDSVNGQIYCPGHSTHSNNPVTVEYEEQYGGAITTARFKDTPLISSTPIIKSQHKDRAPLEMTPVDGIGLRPTTSRYRPVTAPLRTIDSTGTSRAEHVENKDSSLHALHHRKTLDITINTDHLRPWTATESSDDDGLWHDTSSDSLSAGYRTISKTTATRGAKVNTKYGGYDSKMFGKFRQINKKSVAKKRGAMDISGGDKDSKDMAVEIENLLSSNQIDNSHSKHYNIDLSVADFPPVMPLSIPKSPKTESTFRPASKSIGAARRPFTSDTATSNRILLNQNITSDQPSFELTFFGKSSDHGQYVAGSSKIKDQTNSALSSLTKLSALSARPGTAVSSTLRHTSQQPLKQKSTKPCRVSFASVVSLQGNRVALLAPCSDSSSIASMDENYDPKGGYSSYSYGLRHTVDSRHPSEKKKKQYHHNDNNGDSTGFISVDCTREFFKPVDGDSEGQSQGFLESVAASKCQEDSLDETLEACDTGGGSTVVNTGNFSKPTAVSRSSSDLSNSEYWLSKSHLSSKSATLVDTEAKMKFTADKFATDMLKNELKEKTAALEKLKSSLAKAQKDLVEKNQGHCMEAERLHSLLEETKTRMATDQESLIRIQESRDRVYKERDSLATRLEDCEYLFGKAKEQRLEEKQKRAALMNDLSESKVKLEVEQERNKDIQILLKNKEQEFEKAMLVSADQLAASERRFQDILAEKEQQCAQSIELLKAQVTALEANIRNLERELQLEKANAQRSAEFNDRQHEMNLEHLQINAAQEKDGAILKAHIQQQKEYGIKLKELRDDFLKQKSLMEQELVEKEASLKASHEQIVDGLKEQQEKKTQQAIQKYQDMVAAYQKEIETMDQQKNATLKEVEQRSRQYDSKIGAIEARYEDLARTVKQREERIAELETHRQRQGMDEAQKVEELKSALQDVTAENERMRNKATGTENALKAKEDECRNTQSILSGLQRTIREKEGLLLSSEAQISQKNAALAINDQRLEETLVKCSELEATLAAADLKAQPSKEFFYLLRSVVQVLTFGHESDTPVAVPEDFWRDVIPKSFSELAGVLRDVEIAAVSSANSRNVLLAESRVLHNTALQLVEEDKKLKMEMRKMEEEAREARGRVVEVDNVATAQRKQLDKKEAEIRGLERTVKELNLKLEGAMGQCSAAEERLSSTLCVIETRDLLLKNKDAMNGQLKKVVCEKDAEIDTQQLEMKRQAAHIDALESETRTIRSELVTLQSECKSKDAEVATLQEELASEHAAVQQAKTEAQEYLQNSARLHEDITILKAHAEDDLAAITHFEGEAASLTAQLVQSAAQHKAIVEQRDVRIAKLLARLKEERGKRATASFSIDALGPGSAGPGQLSQAGPLVEVSQEYAQRIIGDTLQLLRDGLRLDPLHVTFFSMPLVVEQLVKDYKSMTKSHGEESQIGGRSKAQQRREANGSGRVQFQEETTVKGVLKATKESPSK